MIPTTFPILDFSEKLLNIQPGYKILIFGGGGSILVGMCICSDHLYNMHYKNKTTDIKADSLNFVEIYRNILSLKNGQIFKLVLKFFFEQVTSLKKI